VRCANTPFARTAIFFHFLIFFLSVMPTVPDLDALTDARAEARPDGRTVARLERALSQLSEVVEEVFERRLLEEVLGDADEVSSAQLKTLQFLSSLAPNMPGFTVGEIAAGLRISYPAATKAVDRLAERELAARHRDAGDARSIRVRLTTRGHELVEKLTLERRVRLEGVLARLGGEKPALALLALLEAFLEESAASSG
jgi:DNA-binding MarR family transcriptional regulator